MWAANTPCQYLREIEQTLRGGEYPFNWQTHSKSPCIHIYAETSVNNSVAKPNQNFAEGT